MTSRPEQIISSEPGVLAQNTSFSLMLEVKLMTDKVPYHAPATGRYHSQLLGSQETLRPRWTVLTRWTS